MGIDRNEVTTTRIPLSCKLTTPELQKRKRTILASLRRQRLEKKELANGYAFRFDGRDEMVDTLIDFIKTERDCCSFLSSNLSLGSEKNAAWLELTGPAGTKEFIAEELEW